MSFRSYFVIVIISLFPTILIANETILGGAVYRTDIEGSRMDENGERAFLKMMFTEGAGVELSTGDYGQSGHFGFSSNNLNLILGSSGDVRIYGKVGIAKWEVESIDYNSQKSKVNDWDIMFGVGVGLRAGTVGRISFEVEKFDAEETEIYATSIGIGFAF